MSNEVGNEQERKFAPDMGRLVRDFSFTSIALLGAFYAP